ncbi:hypothetical protein [Amycolatopsis taiwanensis]|uniref:hypothetical protein n=1 Tax=Amycolatopsis taiwanensis TaxID=342230 RepID=UPI0004809896|nr:hypothetical protein [Amycolatopsis taiwanensis]
MTDPVSHYRLEFPEYLAGYEFETEAKGYLPGVRISTEEATFELTVHDPMRLTQDIAAEFTVSGYATFSNLLVVPKVTRDEVARAVRDLAKAGFRGLRPDVQAR